MVFRAPVNGIYYFEATSVADGNGATPLFIYKNGDKVAETGRLNHDTVGAFPLGNGHVVLDLAYGDTVTLFADEERGGIIGGIFDAFNSPSDVTFTGFLVHAY